MRRLPVYGWLGLLLVLVSEVGMLARVEPFASWHTPIAWTGYILLVDAFVWTRRGSSWLNDKPVEFGFLACASVPLWVIFELYNKYTLFNWHYINLPESLPVRYFGYVWSFSTISPAIFETAELISCFRDRRASEHRADAIRREHIGALGWASVALGAAMLALPIVHPSPFLAAPVWLGFIFLLDPLNAHAGAESILGDWRHNRTGRLVNLLVGGLVCGLLWEFWNYWAHTKWVYTVPIFPNVKLFEMPVVGFGGFPPFAVECFVMYVAVRRWLWAPAPRPIAL